jgi:diaminohydroxyphosphoribosylaminopyrimidine deaminase/5-amino-6-(5-phosphoribosylamino)uracil reductase
VVYGIADPNPIAGGGAVSLQAAGVVVDGPLCDEQAKALIAPFWTRNALKRPYVILKWAASLDGKSATAAGHSQWISGSPARTQVHSLRTLVDAIAVGAGTVRLDNPTLTARDVHGKMHAKQPIRVVACGERWPESSSRILQTACDAAPVLLYTAPRAKGESAEPNLHGTECVIVRPGQGGLDVMDWLADLVSRGISSLLVEGGARLAGSLLYARAVDAVVAYIAPLLIGGASAPGPIGNPGFLELTDAPRWCFDHVGVCGSDIVLLAAREKPWQALSRLIRGQPTGGA